MGDSLVDLGDGVKILNPSNFVSGAQDPTERLTKQLGLVNLIGTIEDRKIKRIQEEEDRPFQQQKMKVDLALSTNQLLNIDVENALKHAQLKSTVNEEKRKEASFFNSEANKALDLFKIDPVLGATALQKVAPGVTFESTDKDGVYKASLPTGKDTKREFLIDPFKISDPEKRRTFEGQERDDFAKNTTIQGFKQQSQAWRNMQGLAKQATGAADVGLLYNAMKLWDPNTAVREGEIALGRDTSNIPTNIVNMYNKALAEGGPIFGTDPNSPARQNFIKAARVAFESALDDTISLGNNTYSRVERQGLDAYNTLVPVGGLQPEDFLPVDKLTPEQKQASYIRRKNLLEGK